VLLLPTLNPPSARRTLRGADFRGISRYITIIIRSIILGDEKGAARRRGRRKLLPPPPIPYPFLALAVANLPGFDSDRPNLFSIIQGLSSGIRTRKLFRELMYSALIRLHTPIVECNDDSAGSAERLSAIMSYRPRPKDRLYSSRACAS